MRKVTQEASSCFKNFKSFHKGNTAIEKSKDWNCIYFYLHGNCIAGFNKKSDCLVLSNAWWYSNTTKERLNWILDAFNLGSIFQRNFERFYSKDWTVQKFDWRMQFDWVLFNESSKRFNELMKKRIESKQNQN